MHPLLSCSHDVIVAYSPVRLIRGDAAENEGRIEVFLDYSWKPLCVASFNLHTADVICKSLDYDYAIASKWQNVPKDFYESKYYIKLNCASGNETSVSECEFEKVYFSLCDASERGAAAVICNNSKNVLFQCYFNLEIILSYLIFISYLILSYLMLCYLILSYRIVSYLIIA